MIARTGAEASTGFAVATSHRHGSETKDPDVLSLAHYAPSTRGGVRFRPSPEIIRRSGPRGCQKIKKNFRALGHLGFRDNEGIQNRTGRASRRSIGVGQGGSPLNPAGGGRVASETRVRHRQSMTGG